MKRFAFSVVFCLTVIFISSFPCTAVDETLTNEDEILLLGRVKLADVENIEEADFPRNDWEDINFRIYDPKEKITSKNIHVIWAGNYDEFQVIVYDHNFKPVFEVFNPRFVRYACGGIGCQYWINNIPHEIMKAGPFFLQVQGFSFTLGDVSRYSKVLGFEVTGIEKP